MLYSKDIQQFDVQSYLETKAPNNGSFFAIAIDGRGGSGKTLLAVYLRQVLLGFAVLNGDDYFEPTPNGATWGGFNEDRLEQDVLKPLQKASETIGYRPYIWEEEAVAPVRPITTTGSVCLERCYTFAMNVPWDLKIWVETPKELCLERGLSREAVERDKVEKAWRGVWWPKEDAYISDSKPSEQAEVVLFGTQDFRDQIV